MEFQLVLTPNEHRLLQDQIKKILELSLSGKSITEGKAKDKFQLIKNVCDDILVRTHIGTKLPSGL